MHGGYSAGVALVGIPTFFGCWAYAVYEYGWFLGLGLGWLPSIFIALAAGFLWPLLAAVLVAGIALVIVLSLRQS